MNYIKTSKLIHVTLLLFLAISGFDTSAGPGSSSNPVSVQEVDYFGRPIRDEKGAKLYPLKVDEWVAKYACNSSHRINETTLFGLRVPLSNMWYHLVDTCNRDAHAWRYRYIDEVLPPYDIQILDKSMDSRMANGVYGLNLHSMFDLSYSYFNSGNPKRDARNELAVAGPQVDDAKCARDLARMAEIFDELQELLAGLRHGWNSTVEEQQTFEARHIHLARVLDSFGRYESGNLNGKLKFIGDYDECETSSLPETDARESVKIPMRYCWANINVDRDILPALRERKRSEHETSFTLLNTGVCLPRSCHSRNLRARENKQLVQKFINSQLLKPASIYVHQTNELESVFCLVDQDSEYAKLPSSGKMLLILLACWLLLCVAATIFNQSVKRRNETGLKEPQMNGTPRGLVRKIIQCFDLVQSWDDLTADKRAVSSEHTVDLDTLNPIKVNSCLFCVTAHITFMYCATASSIVQVAAYTDSSAMILSALLLSVVVDTFFVISGILVTYSALKKLARYSEGESNKKVDNDRGGYLFVRLIGQWLAIASNRYLRIVPLYAILFWFRRDVLTYLGWGPLWDYALNKETPNGACLQEPWWTPFTFASALKPLAKQCFIPSWSISNDLIFGIMLTPLIVMFNTRPRAALMTCLTLALFSFLAALDAHLVASPSSMYELLDERLHGVVQLFSSLSHLYSWPIYRASSFLIGMLAGYYLHKYDQRQQEQKSISRAARYTTIVTITNGQRKQQAAGNAGKIQNTLSEMSSPPTPMPLVSASTQDGWPRWLTGPATNLALTYLFVHALIAPVCHDIRLAVDGISFRFLILYFLTADRVIWSVANAIIFLRMVTDWRNKPLMRAFASQLWRTLSKLNFAMIFVHWIMIVVFLGSMPALPVFSQWHVFACFSAVMATSVPIATLLHLVFENPIDKLIKGVIFRNK